MEEKEELSKYKHKPVEQSFPTTKPNENIIPLSCPSCNTPPSMDDINIHDKIAKCGSCATVFSFGQEVKNLAQINEKVEKEVVARPAGIEKSFFHDELELTMQQPTGGMWIVSAILFASIAVLLFLLENLNTGNTAYWFAGIGGLALFFFYKHWNSPNEKIYTVVDKEYLTIQYRPKNLVRDKLIATKEIEQLYIKTLGPKHYTLNAILNSPEGQKHVKLILYIDNRNKARYIELELEKYLGIEDRRLPEE